MQTGNGNNEGREAAMNTYLNEGEATVARKYTNVYVLIYKYLYIDIQMFRFCFFSSQIYCLSQEEPLTVVEKILKKVLFIYD